MDEAGHSHDRFFKREQLHNIFNKAGFKKVNIKLCYFLFDMILQNAEGVKKQIYFDNPDIVDNNAILDELNAFAHAINNNIKPVVTLHDGTEALRIATQIIHCFN